MPTACRSRGDPLCDALELRTVCYNFPGVAGREVFGVVAAEEAIEGDSTCRHASS